MKKIALAVALIGTMSAASAQVYLAGNLGQARIDVDCSDTVSCDKSDIGYKLTAGYQLNPLVALEASYIDFGKVKARVLESGINVDVKGESSGFLLAAALRHNITPEVSLVGRVGLAMLKSKVTASALGFSESENYNSTKPYLGLGAEYALNKQLRLTVGADFTDAKVESETVSVRLLSAGVQYAF